MTIDPVSIAIELALTAATMAVTASQSIEGPRLTDLSVTVADYGTPTNWIWGSRRVQPPVFYAEPIKETSSENKTKGGKYTQYNYFGTLAVIVADHELASYQKVWLDDHLVYDKIDAESTAGTTGSALDITPYVRFYYGTEYQNPDPRMLATVEAQEGAGTCPAYLGVSYVMFEDLPLENFGNRFPQIAVQAATVPMDVQQFDCFPMDFTISTPNPWPGPSVLEPPTPGLYAFFTAAIEVESNSLGYAGQIIFGTNMFGASGSESGTNPFTNPHLTGTYSYTVSWQPGLVTVHIDVTIPDLEVFHGQNTSNEFQIEIFGPEVNWGSDAYTYVSTWHNLNQKTTGRDTYDPLVERWGLSFELTGTFRFTTLEMASACPPPVFSPCIPLGQIVFDVAMLTGMDGGDIDTSQLDQCVYGYSATLGAAREWIAALLELHDSDIRPNGYLLEGIKRGGARDGPVIESKMFVRTGKQDPRYSAALTSESDLPRRLFVTFSDINADQQPNTATAQRNSTSVLTTRETSFDLTTLAISATNMQMLTERALRRPWIGSLMVDCKMTPRELLMNPGDVRDLSLDGELVRAKLKRMRIAPNRMLTTTWEQDRAAPYVPPKATTPSIIYDAAYAAATDPTTDDPGMSSASLMSDATAGAEAVGRPPTTMYSPVDSTTFVLDIPLISDADNQSTPFLYVAGGPISAGDWPGLDISHSASGSVGSYSAGWDTVSSGNGATYGVAGRALGPALTSVIDEGSDLVVFLTNGSLESITQEDMDNNDSLNAIMYGNERIQFRDAILQSEGELVLKGLYRGMRGTEQYVSSHVDGERILLLSRKIKRHDVGAGKIGDTDYYSGMTFLRTVNAQGPFALDFTAAAHKPLSPANVILTRDPASGDWTIAWQRRSRIGGGALNGQDIPLGETSELYKVKIMAGQSSGGFDPIRTLTSTSQSLIYTAGEQALDWGGPITSLSVEVCQVSPALGIDGFYTAASA